MTRVTPAVRAALVFLAAGAIGCDRPPIVTAPAAVPDPALVAELRRIGYRGPALIAERTITDRDGTRPMARTLFLPPRGLAQLAARDSAGAAVAAIRQALGPTQALNTPDEADPAHNSVTANLGTLIRPSRLNGNGAEQVTVNFSFRFLSYDYAADDWYIVPGGEVLQSVIRARDSSSGHWHGSRDTMQLRLPVRVGTLTPPTGTFASSWSAQWRVPEVSNEVNIRFYLREIGGPNDGETNWFYGLENDAVRYGGLQRITANTTRYLLQGGTGTHPEAFNDYGTADMITRIQEVAESYWNATARPATPTTPAVPGDRTRVNDISLFFGGRFDVGRTINRVYYECTDAATQHCWQYSHYEHRTGTEVDINPETRQTPSNRTRFYRSLATQFPSIYVEGNHYHARTPSSPYLPRAQ